MNKCSITDSSIKQIKQDTNKILLTSMFKSKNDLTRRLSLIKEGIIQKLTEYKDAYQLLDETNRVNVIETIFSCIKDDIKNSDINFFNTQNLSNLVLDSIINGVKLESTDYKLPTSQVEKNTSVLDFKQIKDEFLLNAYGSAVEVRLEAVNLFNKFMVNAVIMNREKGSVTKNTANLNSNLQALQNQLLDTIYDYLESLQSDDATIQQLVENRPRMFKDQKYTDVVKQLSQYLNVLSNPETLMKFRAQAKNGNIKSKKALDAYNAYVLLKNFNQYLKLIFKENVLIKKPNIYQYDQYVFSEQGKNITNSWRRDENINVADEISGICKMIIGTTDRYSWNTGAKLNGSVTFQEFEYIIAKIKELGDSFAADAILLDSTKLPITLSTETLETVDGYTLAGLINSIRNNPQEILPAVFELLSNKQFYAECKQHGVFTKFKSFELNTILSIYKGIFSNEKGSARATDAGYDNQFFYKLCSVADNIFPTQFMQYYTDEEGNLKIRNLTDRHYEEESRNIENIIQAYLHPDLGVIDTLVDRYVDKSLEVTKKDKNGDEIITQMSIMIPNTDLHIEVNNLGQVTFFKDKEKVAITGEDLNNQYLQQFVEDIFHQGIFNPYSKDLLNALIEEYNGQENQVMSDLLSDCARILFVAQINQRFPQKNRTDLQNLINRQFEKGNYKIDYNFGQVKVFGNNVTLLKQLAAAKLALNGLGSAINVKDGEGNMQNTVTLSRLLGMYQTQFSDIKSYHLNAAYNFLVLDKNIFQGVVTSKEFYTGSNTKQELDFTVSEFAYASFMSDYIGGLVTQADEGLGKGIIGILPSENSDKKVIGKMKINVDAPLRDGRTIRKLSPHDLAVLAQQQFGNAYRQLEQNIIRDYRTLFSWANLSIDTTDIPTIIKELNNLWGNNAYNELNTRIRLYNKSHTPINFIDQLHLIRNKNGSLSYNIALEGILNRFSSVELTEAFFNEREKQVLEDLLNSDFKVDLSEDKTAEQKHLRIYEDWINQSGYMVLAKARLKNGTVVNIVNKNDLNNIVSEISSIDLHPELSKYNRLDYIFSEEFLLATVGTHLTHPSKYSGTNPNEDEALRKKAQNKRNVSMTASLKQFLLHSFKGIPNKYNIAVVEDIKDSQYNVMGNVEDGVKPYDGATFANPFIVLLENNSLEDAVGVDKKPFVHFYNPATASGGIIKTASFGLTNDRIRNSKQNAILMKKMTDRKYTDQDGNPISYDTTYSDTGMEKVIYDTDENGNLISKTIITNQVIYDIPIYYKEGNIYYQEINRAYLGDNKYGIVRVECNESGESYDYSNIPTENAHNGLVEYNGKYYAIEEGAVIGEYIEIAIDSNYTLWQSFGGANSLEIKNGRLQPSENSIKLVVHTMNYANRVNSLGDVEQPLKNFDIHYIVTEGAIKQGAANVNYHQKYIDVNGNERLSNRYNDDSELSIMTIDIKQAGIQLDKEHHADNSEISMFTQVISACAARGYSLERASKLYRALRSYTDLATKQIREAVQEYFDDIQKAFAEGTPQEEVDRLLGKDTIYQAVNKSVIKALSTSGINETNFATVIAKDIIQDLRNGKKIDFGNPVIPYSDSTLFNKVVSIISVALTNAGIKSKMPGILCVLNPSFGIMKLYGDRKLESFNSEEDIQRLQDTYRPIFIASEGKLQDGSISKIDIGRKYTITINGVSTIRNIVTPKDYYNLRKDLELEIPKGSEISITEYIMNGRDLASYNARFVADGVGYQLYDLKSIQDLYDFEENKVIPEGYTEDSYRQYLRDRLQEDLFKLSPDYKGTNNTVEIVTLGRTKEVTIDRDSIEIQPYEVIMPKTFLREFNLDTYDNVFNITKDKLFFIRKLLRSYQSKIQNEELFDVELKRLNGNHFYILDKSHATRLTNDMTKLEIETINDENGNVFRVDEYGDVMYQLSSNSDSIFVDKNGNEVIVTNDVKYYVDHLNYNSLRFTNSRKVSYDWLLGLIKDSKNSNLKYINEYFKDATDQDTFIRLNQDLNSINDIKPESLREADLRFAQNKVLALLNKQGIKIHTSFLKSLEIVAARIPAQSMQSFMPMKVIAYENANVNTAYVSTAQIWLQGSDYRLK